MTTGATIAPCASRPAFASSTIGLRIGAALSTTALGFLARAATSRVASIASKSKAAGRHGIRMKSAALAAAKEARSAVQGRIDEEKVSSVGLSGSHELGEPLGVVPDNFGLRLALVAPSSCRTLWVEVHDSDLKPVLLGGDRQMDGQRGFPRAAFLR